MKKRYCETKNSIQRSFYLHPADLKLVKKAVSLGGFKSVAAFASDEVFKAAAKILRKYKKY